MNTDYYISLIYQQLKGAIDSDAERKLRAWEASSPENRQIASEIRKAWKSSATHDLPFDLDFDSDFSKVQSRLDVSEKSTAKIVQIKPRRMWLRIAAAGLILVVAGLVFNNMQNQEVAWTIAKTTTETKEIKLPDGSKVWLNSNSSLSYPEVFSEVERPVKLTGEAFFEVEKNANRPFHVSTQRTIVTVLGTAFNVRDLTDEVTSSISVQEGKVRVETTKNQQKVILTANEKAIYDEKTGKLIEEEDANLNDLAWQRKSLIFNNTSFAKAIAVISKQFQSNITINKIAVGCTVSGRYRMDTDVENLLNNIASINNIQVKKIQHNVFELSGGNCE